jgi:sulfate transport system substrate-binding protein
MRNARYTRRRSVKAGLSAALLVLLVAVFAAGCGSSSSNSGSNSSSGGAKLAVVGYSTPESVYTETLEPAFEKTAAGKGISFSNSFGASGDQSRAVVAGQPASIVHFSQAGDMERLVEEGELVAKNWEKQPYGGIATDSVVVILVKKGNPLGIVQLRLGPLEHHGRLRQRPRRRRLAQPGAGSGEECPRKDGRAAG